MTFSHVFRQFARTVNSPLPAQLCDVIKPVLENRFHNLKRWITYSPNRHLLRSCSSFTYSRHFHLASFQVFHQRRVLSDMASKVQKTEEMDMYMVDMAVPNEGWSDESKLWFNKLNELTKSGEWKKMKSFVHGKYSKALFTRSVSVGHPGKFFEYAFFCNKEESMLRGVCQFGSRTEGPPSHAHGGAVASIIDAASGVLCHYVSRVPRVTANMNINYRRPTPLCETILTEAHVDKTEGRKSFISCKLTSPDGKTIYAEGTVLFIQIDVSNIPQLNQE